jgi:hypothetical protein
MADTAQIVKSGTWQYDGCVLHEVWIVKQNFDFYYDDGFEDAPEDLNEDGELFQVVIAKDGEVLSVGLAFHSIEQAIAKAHNLTMHKVNEFYKKGCQEKALPRPESEIVSRDPAHRSFASLAKLLVVHSAEFLR